METEPSGQEEDPVEPDGDDVSDAGPDVASLLGELVAVPPSAVPSVRIIDAVLKHLEPQSLRAERKQAVRLALEALRFAVVDLGARVDAAEAEQARLAAQAEVERTQRAYNQRVAEALDHRNETLVIALVEAVGRLDVAAASLRQVRARVGMQHIIQDPPGMPT